jgi:hypothetical protein
MAKEHRDDVSPPEDERSDAERKREEIELDPENERAVETAKNIATDYVHSNRVEGYGRQDDGYGGPYHPDAFNDPQVKFALAGAPEAQAKFTDELIELDKAKAKDSKGGIDKVDLVAASAHSTVVEEQPYRAASETIEVEATHDNVAEAAARKHFIVPRNDEDAEAAFSRVFKDSATKPAKDANDAPERLDEEPSRNTAGTEAEGANDEGDGEKTGSNAPGNSDSNSDVARKTEATKETAKQEPAKKTAAKKSAPAKKSSSKRTPTFDKK